MSHKDRSARQASESSESRRENEVPIYRRCPLCWGTRKGTGTVYCTQGRTRYYKCDSSMKPGESGGCGYTWSAIVRLETVRIEHRRVDLQTRD